MLDYLYENTDDVTARIYLESIDDHIVALTEGLRECANGFPSPGQLAASELLAQIDPPPPTQTINAVKLEGKVRL